MPQALVPLLALYSVILVINLLVSSVLWARSRHPLYGALVRMWFGTLVSFGCLGLVAERSAELRALVFISSVLATAPGAALSGALLGFELRMRPFLLTALAAALTSLGLWRLGLGMPWVAIPSCLAPALPPLVVAVRTWRIRRSGKLTLASGALVLTNVILALHVLDYPFADPHPELRVPGFTLALVLVFMNSVFAPAAIVEVLTAENTQLRVRTELEAKFAHAARMSQLGEVAGGLAHELNNPLAIITVVVNNLVDQADEGPIAAEQLQKASKQLGSSVRRMTGIIRGLLLFSGDKDSGSFVVTPVSELFENFLNLCGERIRRGGIELRTGPVPQVSISCNQPQLLQALLALVDNSIEAVSASPSPWVGLEAKARTGRLEIAVTDSGTGIAPEVRAKLMQPFFTTKPIGKGTGLGLSVAKGIAETHGGTLRYDAGSPHTRFAMELPL